MFLSVYSIIHTWYMVREYLVLLYQYVPTTRTADLLPTHKDPTGALLAVLAVMSNESISAYLVPYV